jgi:hypothetical protein
MTTHPYLRAYLAGIAVPTAYLPLGLTAFVFAQRAGILPTALERMIVFPMAAVPNLWGIWNVLYVALVRRGARWSIGAHGAVLTLLLLPAGVALSHALLVEVFTLPRVAAVLPVALVLYYLIWKHVVGFLNRLLGVQS